MIVSADKASVLLACIFFLIIILDMSLDQPYRIRIKNLLVLGPFQAGVPSRRMGLHLIRSNLLMYPSRQTKVGKEKNM